MMKWKPIEKRVRIVYGDGEFLNGVDSVKANPGKVFAVIGPFDDHTDKQDLQDLLQLLLMAYNIEDPGATK